MDIWINKCINEERTTSFQDSLIFNIGVPGCGGVVASDIRTGWHNLLGYTKVPEVCEDLFIIALSVFAVDKRVPRSKFPDAWTRTVRVNIPVLEIEKWEAVKPELEKMLSFLSGDIWSFSFRPASPENRYQDFHKREPHRNEVLNQINAVSLFSGGMDSYCGAYELLSQGNNVVFVGFKEYDRLKDIQADLLDGIQAAVPNAKSLLFRFTAKAYAPVGDMLRRSENTSRSRSFLFLCAAICVAELIGDHTPVYIPEKWIYRFESSNDIWPKRKL